MAEFEYKKQGDLGVLAISGRFTLVDKDDFQAALGENFDLDSQDVALDARNLEYIDSSGIGDFIKLKMEVTKKNRAVYVFGLQEAVDKTFRSARLESVFTIMTEDEFAAKFGAV